MARSKRNSQQPTTAEAASKLKHWHVMVLLTVVAAVGFYYWDNLNLAGGGSYEPSSNISNNRPGRPNSNSAPSRFNPDRSDPSKKTDPSSTLSDNRFPVNDRDNSPGSLGQPQPFAGGLDPSNPQSGSPFGTPGNTRPANQDPSGAVLPTPVR